MTMQGDESALRKAVKATRAKVDRAMQEVNGLTPIGEMGGGELQALRKAVGLTGAALADAIGMSRKSIVEMEAGRAPVELRTELAVRYVVERMLVVGMGEQDVVRDIALEAKASEQ